MNNLILSFLVAVVALFHLAARSTIKQRKVREAFCAHWCVDAVFAISGTAISFALYNYDIAAFFKLHNILPGVIYLLATVLLVLLAPSGHSLLTRKQTASREEILLAEYRFNDTLCLIRNFFLALLFTLPLLLTLVTRIGILLPLFHTWSQSEICGAFCFIVFLILLPVSLRQALFWLKALVGTPDARETHALQQYHIRLHYKTRNLRL